MRLGSRFVIFIDRFKRKVKVAKDYSLHQTAALIRKEARESLRISQRTSKPGNPPHSRTRGGLREINYDVNAAGTRAYIGPRKFHIRNRLNRPVPNVHETGGIAIERGRRGRPAFIKRYPERSFMYRAVKKLQSKGKLSSKFRYMLRSF